MQGGIQEMLTDFIQKLQVSLPPPPSEEEVVVTTSSSCCGGAASALFPEENEMGENEKRKHKNERGKSAEQREGSRLSCTPTVLRLHRMVSHFQRAVRKMLRAHLHQSYKAEQEIEGERRKQKQQAYQDRLCAIEANQKEQLVQRKVVEETIQEQCVQYKLLVREWLTRMEREEVLEAQMLTRERLQRELQQQRQRKEAETFEAIFQEKCRARRRALWKQQQQEEDEADAERRNEEEEEEERCQIFMESFQECFDAQLSALRDAVITATRRRARASSSSSRSVSSTPSSIHRHHRKKTSLLTRKTIQQGAPPLQGLSPRRASSRHGSDGSSSSFCSSVHAAGKEEKAAATGDSSLQVLQLLTMLRQEEEAQCKKVHDVMQQWMQQWEQEDAMMKAAKRQQQEDKQREKESFLLTSSSLALISSTSSLSSSSFSSADEPEKKNHVPPPTHQKEAAAPEVLCTPPLAPLATGPTSFQQYQLRVLHEELRVLQEAEDHFHEEEAAKKQQQLQHEQQQQEAAAKGDIVEEVPEKPSRFPFLPPLFVPPSSQNRLPQTSHEWLEVWRRRQYEEEWKGLQRQRAYLESALRGKEVEKEQQEKWEESKDLHERRMKRLRQDWCILEEEGKQVEKEWLKQQKRIERAKKIKQKKKKRKSFKKGERKTGKKVMARLLKEVRSHAKQEAEGSENEEVEEETVVEKRVRCRKHQRGSGSHGTGRSSSAPASFSRHDSCGSGRGDPHHAARSSSSLPRPSSTKKHTPVERPAQRTTGGAKGRSTRSPSPLPSVSSLPSHSQSKGKQVEAKTQITTKQKKKEPVKETSSVQKTTTTTATKKTSKQQVDRQKGKKGKGEKDDSFYQWAACMRERYGETKSKEKEEEVEPEEEDEEEDSLEVSLSSSTSSYDGIMEDAHTQDRSELRRLYRELVWLQASLRIPLPRPWAARLEHEQLAVVALKKLVHPLTECRQRLLATIRHHQREAVAVSLIAAQDKEHHAGQQQAALAQVLDQLEMKKMQRHETCRRTESQLGIFLSQMEQQRASTKEAAALLAQAREKRKRAEQRLS